VHLGFENFDEAGSAQLMPVLGSDDYGARLLAVETGRWGHDCVVVVEGSWRGKKEFRFPAVARASAALYTSGVSERFFYTSWRENDGNNRGIKQKRF
jgi:hypothetical protein